MAEELPGTFEVTIAVGKTGVPFLLDWPDWLDPHIYQDLGSDPEDQGFRAVPSSPGVWRCTVYAEWPDACGEGLPSFPIHHYEPATPGRNHP